MNMTSFIKVRTQVEGLHHWPDAVEPERYLHLPHRHLFVVTAEIEVFHDDREIEINAAARWLYATVTGFGQPPEDDGPVDFGPQSCEHLARRSAEAVAGRYGPRRRLRCEVLEDGILGAGVRWNPTTVNVD